jgi:hypothetical protein
MRVLRDPQWPDAWRSIGDGGVPPTETEDVDGKVD